MEYPWYFETNSILDVWSMTMGDGVVVDLFDSCVDFNLPALKGKNIESMSCTRGDLNNVEVIHGTAMAGIIAAEHTKLKLKNSDDEQFVTGIAPKALIKNTEGINVHNIKKALEEAHHRKLKTKFGEKVFKSPKDRERPEIVLINLSGGQKTQDPEGIRKDWFELIKNLCKNQENVLIMASVGNSYTKLTHENIVDRGILPAALKPRNCTLNNWDPILRVGASNKYKENRLNYINLLTVVAITVRTMWIF